jgi:glycosyltransferase involved in cell wall biosynthesis
MSKPFFSIAIPTYEMHGLGIEYLSQSLSVLNKQSFKDFEVIISDHSADNRIKDCCQIWTNEIDIKYFRNDYKVGESSPNINNAIKKSTGEWIKILFQDDFLYGASALEDLKTHIITKKKIRWIATACEHTYDGKHMHRPFYPSWNEDIHTGVNTISSPSVITIINDKEKLYFNEDLIWLMDVEYYKRMHDIYGEPSYLHKVNVVNREWSNSLSNTLSAAAKNKEITYLKEKYKKL